MLVRGYGGFVWGWGWLPLCHGVVGEDLGGADGEFGGGGGCRWPFAEWEARRGVFRVGSVWGTGDGYVVYTKCWCYEE